MSNRSQFWLISAVENLQFVHIHNIHKLKTKKGTTFLPEIVLCRPYSVKISQIKLKEICMCVLFVFSLFFILFFLLYPVSRNQDWVCETIISQDVFRLRHECFSLGRIYNIYIIWSLSQFSHFWILETDARNICNSPRRAI